MGKEFRVIWQRANCRIKRKRYVSRKLAERMLALLVSKEPWTLLSEYAGRGPDDLECCTGVSFGGYPCGCGGKTVRAFFADKYAEYPAIEWARIEEREVGAWEQPKP